MYLNLTAILYVFGQGNPRWDVQKVISHNSDISGVGLRTCGILAFRQPEPPAGKEEEAIGDVPDWSQREDSHVGRLASQRAPTLLLPSVRASD